MICSMCRMEGVISVPKLTFSRGYRAVQSHEVSAEQATGSVVSAIAADLDNFSLVSGNSDRVHSKGKIARKDW